MERERKESSEVVVHTVRSFLETTDKATMIKLDFRNAFNENKRGIMLREIHHQAPEVYPMALQAYCTFVPLLYGEHIIMSEQGCQQGMFLDRPHSAFCYTLW